MRVMFARKFSILLIALIAFCGCRKSDDIYGGYYIKDGIVKIEENGGWVEANQYVLELPPDGGVRELTLRCGEYLSIAFVEPADKIDSTSRYQQFFSCDGIRILLDDDLEILEYDRWRRPRYWTRTLRISADANESSKPRKVSFCFEYGTEHMSRMFVNQRAK